MRWLLTPYVIRLGMAFLGGGSGLIWWSVLSPLPSKFSSALVLTILQVVFYYAFGSWLESTYRKRWHDPLTELPNRAYADQVFASLQDPFSITLLDIDWFKQFNDTHGHLVGDKLLQRVSKILESSVRKTDHVIRWGGEEFLIVFPHSGLNTAVQITDRIRETVLRETGVTVSAGCSTGSRSQIQSAIQKADQLLYEAKQSRNTVLAKCL
ncbi:GGDEF domain-containing protein [Effusibacillus consociatus]|uniref:GGDEF domain-containing protein n=1 Tax=Effusibacillus consociatus TaxID=1117041 RepID=A0ABV9PZD2_9BACL